MSSQTATSSRAPHGRGRRRQGWLARVAADARVAWAVAMVLAVALAVASLLFAPLVIAERDRGQVESVAASMASRLTTFSGDDLESWAGGVEALATQAYAEQVTELLDETVRERMAQSGAVSAGRVTDTYVQALDGRAAAVFVVVRQTTSNAEREGTVESTVRMTMTLRRGARGWLVDNVSVLPGPAGPAFESSG